MRQIIIYLILVYCGNIFGQEYLISDSLQKQYSFINWEANKIKHSDSSIVFKKLYHKLDAIYNNKKETTIVQYVFLKIREIVPITSQMFSIIFRGSREIFQVFSVSFSG